MSNNLDYLLVLCMCLLPTIAASMIASMHDYHVPGQLHMIDSKSHCYVECEYNPLLFMMNN